jgi:anti-sigma B factor antagonist
MTGAFEESIEFRMCERFDDPDGVRLVLTGELDLAVAEMLGSRLRQLRNEGYDVRLDLSELEFIDSSGLRELIVAVSEARSDGWRLEIDPHMTKPVRRTVEIAGLRSHLWPDSG